MDKTLDNIFSCFDSDLYNAIKNIKAEISEVRIRCDNPVIVYIYNKPFLILKSGHAFAGVFLEEETFPSMIYNDAPHALEMNSQEENEIVFVECTAYTADNPSSFEEACEHGRLDVSSSVSDPLFSDDRECVKLKIAARIQI